jgi:probable HAF family extracellular repeat protein
MRNTLSTAMLVVWSGCAVAQNYVLTDLTTPNRLVYSDATGINDAGQVSGMSYGSVGGPHATIWNGTVATQLTIPGGAAGYAFGINESGQVVGTEYINGGSAVEGVLWNGIIATILQPAGGIYDAYSVAVGENNVGQAVGRSGSTGNSNGWHATIWNGTSPTDLGPPSAFDSAAEGINDAGQVVGFSAGPYSPAFATLWNGTTGYTILGTLPGTFSYSSAADGINAAGQIVGYSYSSEEDIHGAVTHATIWNGTTPMDLGTLGGASSAASAINDRGQIVGQSETASVANHAALWDSSGNIIDLNSRIAPSLAIYVTLSSANAINNHGWIAANGTDSRSQNQQNAYLLRPIPDAMAALLTEVTGVGPGQSLANKVTAAQTYYAVPDIQATCAMLTGFVNEVQAQDGKKIDPTLDAKLIADAQAIEAAIGCN